MESKKRKTLSKQHSEVKQEADFKITRNKNDWKFEFTISKDGFKYLRPKFYGKTAFLLTCLGVSNKNIRDPLSKLLLTSDHWPTDEYHRKLLTHKG